MLALGIKRILALFIGFFYRLGTVPLFASGRPLVVSSCVRRRSTKVTTRVLIGGLASGTGILSVPTRMIAYG